jgi:CRP-like cAMP-binding protein
VDFLATLAPMQFEAIAQGSHMEQFLSGERVVWQGGPGYELYVIVEGRADVVVEQNRLSSVVNQLSAGQFFGEMSLRVIVVGKDLLVQIVQEDRRVIERIGDVITRRQASTLAAKQELDREASIAAGRHQARPLIERIQNFLWGQAKG